MLCKFEWKFQCSPLAPLVPAVDKGGQEERRGGNRHVDLFSNAITGPWGNALHSTHSLAGPTPEEIASGPIREKFAGVPKPFSVYGIAGRVRSVCRYGAETKLACADLLYFAKQATHEIGISDTSARSGHRSKNSSNNNSNNTTAERNPTPMAPVSFTAGTETDYQQIVRRNT